MTFILTLCLWAIPCLFCAETRLDGQETVLLALVNDYRIEHNLGRLAVSETLVDTAPWMSEDMARHAYFSHTDSLGRDTFDRMLDFGYPTDVWRGENLAVGYESEEAVLTAWRDSPGHDDNLLNTHFLVVGLARRCTLSGGCYWAAEFGGYSDRPCQGLQCLSWG